MVTVNRRTRRRVPLPDEEPSAGMPPVLELTPEEARAVFDRKARRLLGISGEEFVRRWEAGEYCGDEETDEARLTNRLVMSLPLVKSDFRLDDADRCRGR